MMHILSNYTRFCASYPGSSARWELDVNRLTMLFQAACSVAKVDVEGFEQELQSQKMRSREALKGIDLTAGRLLGELAGQLGTSDFIGYEHGSLRAEASVLAILKEGKTVDSASAGASTPCCLQHHHTYYA